MRETQSEKVLFKKNGAKRLVCCRVATKLQFVKNTGSAKCSKAKQNKTRCAWKGISV